MKKISPLLYLFIGLALLLFTSLAISILSKTAVNEDLQQSLEDSQFITLSHGEVQYQDLGPEKGELVILVSGFSVPYYCWDPIVNDLSQDYRVIRYNHYGRGFSDRAGSKYKLELFVNQLDEMVEAFGKGQPVHIVGLSMGGLVSSAYSSIHTDRVKSLTLIAPSGFPIEKSFSQKLAEFPLMGEIIMTLFGDSILAGRNPSNLFHPGLYPEFQQQYLEQLELRGFKGAILSSLRHSGFTASPWVYAELAKTDLPILMFWGMEDQVIPYAQHRLIMAEGINLKFISVENAGHNAQYEQPELVVNELLRFLER